MGIMYLSAPLVFGVLVTFPHTRRPAFFIGLITMCLALGLSSLSQTVTHLIATQGVIYAIGGALAYSPAILFMDEWFVKRKGFAFGVMWVCTSRAHPCSCLFSAGKENRELMVLQAGTGLGGVAIPLLLQYLLSEYGFRTTLRVWAIVLFVATLPLTLYLKPRLPVAQSSNLRPYDLSFLKNKTFLVLQAGNVLEGE